MHPSFEGGPKTELDSRRSVRYGVVRRVTLWASLQVRFVRKGDGASLTRST